MLERWIEQGDLDACRIGTIEKNIESIDFVSVIDKDNNLLAIEKPGYNHFGH